MGSKISTPIVKDNEKTAPTLTIRQVSRLLNMHSNTVMRWIIRGIIRPSYITSKGDQRIRPEDIARFLLEANTNNRKQRRLVACSQT